MTGRVAEGEWITGGLWGAYDQWAQGTAGGAARERFTPDLEAAAELRARTLHTIVDGGWCTPRTKTANRPRESSR